MELIYLQAHGRLADIPVSQAEMVKYRLHKAWQILECFNHHAQVCCAALRCKGSTQGRIYVRTYLHAAQYRRLHSCCCLVHGCLLLC